jgi:hypothetical protein
VKPFPAQRSSKRPMAIKGAPSASGGETKTPGKVAKPGKFKTPKAEMPAEVQESCSNEQEVVSLPGKQVQAVLDRESDEVRAVLAQFQQQIADVRTQLADVQAEVEAGQRPTSGGVSYLELKLQLLLSYCTHLSFYLLLKAEGMVVKGHPVIEKLVETRTYMEKLRPLDAKLKYQMDKLLKTGLEGADNAAAGSGDALKFKPNIDALQVPDFGGGDDDDASGTTRAGRRCCLFYHTSRA